MATDVATERAQGTTYDAVGRATIVTTYADTFENVGTPLTDTVTRYLASGKTDMVGSAATAGTSDSGRTWTKTLYDPAGRAYETLANYDTTGNTPLLVTSFDPGAIECVIGAKCVTGATNFESGTTEGVAGASNWAVGTASTVSATSGAAASGTANSGFGALSVTPGAASGSGVSLALSGNFLAGHQYKAMVYAKAAAGSPSWQLTLGASGDSSSGNATVLSSSTYTPVSATWTASAGHTAGVLVAVVDTADSGNVAVSLDDIEVWDTSSPAGNDVPSITAYDADGHAVASVLPGGAAGDSPMVTRTAYDALGRVADVTVDAVAGATETDANRPDVNLRTHTEYDALGRAIAKTDPAGVVSHYEYNNLGNMTAAIADYGGLNITAQAAYDALGEVVATCSANAAATCTSSNITSSDKAWHYSYDLDGHQVLAVPPVNATLTALDVTATVYDSIGGQQVASVVSCTVANKANCTASANADRHTDMTYDAMGRPKIKITYAGAGTTVEQLKTAMTYDDLGEALSVTSISPTGPTIDTIESVYDDLGRVTSMYEGSHAPGIPGADGNAQTEAMTYNPDGTLHTRTDYVISSTTASVYAYDKLGRLTNATSPTFAAGVSVSFSWRLDGLMATRSWSSGPAALVYAYDGAKRPVRECNGSGGACTNTPQIDIERTYDRNGNVKKETQVLSTGADVSQNGTQSFDYDHLGRVTTSSINDPESYKVEKAYAYDSDGNRLTVTVGTVITDSFAFDAADETVSDTHGGTTTNFAYDRYGNLLSSGTAAGSTTYAYDLADRLNSITQAGGAIVGFTFDAGGRHATRTAGTGQNLTTIDTYAYLGTSNSVIRDVSTVGGGTVNAGLDSMGDRLSTSATGGFAWIVPDLHGNVAAQCASAGSIIDVFRYDAYGNALGSPQTASTVPSPWRFQGRILESTSGSDTYDFTSRAYVPDLGTFTSLDSVAGGAQNPMTLNRYLYANANPASLVDPDGHSTQNCVVYGICLEGDERRDGSIVGSTDGGTTSTTSTTSTGGAGGNTTTTTTTTPTNPSDPNPSTPTDAASGGKVVTGRIWYYHGLPIVDLLGGRDFPLDPTSADSIFHFCADFGDQVACQLYANYRVVFPALDNLTSALIVTSSGVQVLCMELCPMLIGGLSKVVFPKGFKAAISIEGFEAPRWFYTGKDIAGDFLWGKMDFWTSMNGGQDIMEWIKSKGLTAPERGDTAGWAAMSKAYARSAQGDVFVVIGHEAKSDSLLFTAEKDELLSNPSVRSISIVDLRTGKVVTCTPPFVDCPLGP